MKVIDISDELFRELDEDDSISVASINYWLRGNIGKLNSLIYTDFAITGNGSEITPELDEEEKTILKKMYLIYFYEKKIRANLQAASLDSITELDDDGTTVRLTSKNELAKTWSLNKKDEINELNKLIQGHNSKQSTPRQVTGDDETIGFPSNSYYEAYRRTWPV